MKPLSLYCKHLLTSTFLLVALFSCKKKESTDEVPDTGSREEMTKDSIFLYAKQVYLWYDALPTYTNFNPRKYSQLTTPLENYEKELFDISQFKINPVTNLPYEFVSATDKSPKYSYIDDLANQNPVAVIPGKQSSVDLNGNGFDFGLRVALYGSPTKYYVIVQAVHNGSDAAGKKISRGDTITTINNIKIGSNYYSEIDYVNTSLFDASTVSLKIAKVAGSNPATLTTTLTKTSYVNNPIYKDSVYISGSKKVGYFAYARFSSLTNSKPELDRVFTRFSNEGVTDLIIDLRYNGGGYVSTAEYLLNLIAPQSLNGKVMYKEYFNDLMQKGKAPILAKQPVLDNLDRPTGSTYKDVDYSVTGNTNYFLKQGILNNINNVIFITSESTASASELVINSLKPYLNVKTVGTTSYGKPVGFFPIRIDKFDVYFSMFESKNANGEGGYYTGIQPSTGLSVLDDDDPRYAFGDLKEASLAAAYNYLTKGSYTASVKSGATVFNRQPASLLADPKAKNLSEKDFKGLIKDHWKFN